MKDKLNLTIRGLNYVTKRNISTGHLNYLQNKFGVTIGRAKKQGNVIHGSDNHICVVRNNNGNVSSTATHSSSIFENNQKVNTVFLSKADFYNATKNNANLNRPQYIFYRDTYNIQRVNLSPSVLAKLDDEQLTRWFYLFELQSNYPIFWRVLDKKLNQISQNNNLANLVKYNSMQRSTDNMLSFVFVDYSTPSMINTPILL